MSETERLTTEMAEGRDMMERAEFRLWAKTQEANELKVERDEAQAEVERLTAERDAARAEVKRLKTERDQTETRPKGREVGRFGLDGHYLDAMEPTRPTDEDIWREAFITMLPSFPWEKAAEKSDCVLVEYRKRWPR